MDFFLEDWSAFAPGLERKEEWLAWARSPWLPCGEAMPSLMELPPMQRRRVERLGRMALQVAYRCLPEHGDGTPMVFASRHGDLARTFEMLSTMAWDQPLSPTQFSLSTHNAITAQYSIARRVRGNYLSVSAGPETIEAAMTEAFALLRDGAAEVLVVVYDEPIPPAYGIFDDEPQAPFAWAARLSLAGERRPSFSLATTRADDGIDAPGPLTLPHALQVLQFLIGSGETFHHQVDTRCFRWQHHA